MADESSQPGESLSARNRQCNRSRRIPTCQPPPVMAGNESYIGSMLMWVGSTRFGQDWIANRDHGLRTRADNIRSLEELNENLRQVQIAQSNELDDAKQQNIHLRRRNRHLEDRLEKEEKEHSAEVASLQMTVQDLQGQLNNVKEEGRDWIIELANRVRQKDEVINRLWNRCLEKDSEINSLNSKATEAKGKASGKRVQALRRALERLAIQTADMLRVADIRYNEVYSQLRQLREENDQLRRNRSSPVQSPNEPQKRRSIVNQDFEDRAIIDFTALHTQLELIVHECYDVNQTPVLPGVSTEEQMRLLHHWEGTYSQSQLSNRCQAAMYQILWERILAVPLFGLYNIDPNLEDRLQDVERLFHRPLSNSGNVQGMNSDYFNDLVDWTMLSVKCASVVSGSPKSFYPNVVAELMWDLMAPLLRVRSTGDESANFEVEVRERIEHLCRDAINLMLALRLHGPYHCNCASIGIGPGSTLADVSNMVSVYAEEHLSKDDAPSQFVSYVVFGGLYRSMTRDGNLGEVAAVVRPRVVVQDLPVAVVVEHGSVNEVGDDESDL